MKLTAAALASLLGSACVVHVHVHESPESSSRPRLPEEEAPLPEGRRGELRPETGWVRGVLSGASEGARTRIAAVVPFGSYSTSTTEGDFVLGGFRWEEFALHVSTDDQRAAILVDVKSRTQGVRVHLEAGGTVEVDLAGHEQLRCAFLRDGIHVEDSPCAAASPRRS